MKIAICQINTTVGDFENNRKKIIEQIEISKNIKSDLVIFPELLMSGGAATDVLEFKNFVNNCSNELNEISKHTDNISAIIGSPTCIYDGDDRVLFNSAVFMQNGKIENTINKHNLCNSDVFFDSRYFAKGECENACINLNNKNIFIEIGNIFCKTFKSVADEDKLINDWSKKNIDIFINISATPFSAEIGEMRFNFFRKAAKKLNAIFVFVNTCGAQTELVYDGRSMVVFPDGRYKILNSFEEDFFAFEIDRNAEFSTLEYKENKIALIQDALVCGIKDYFFNNGFKKIILGLSGGIDSAVVASLACSAVGSENVFGLLMPSQFSTDHSVKDAVDLAENLKMKYEIIPIKDSFEAITQSLKNVFKDLPFDVTEENIQARIRGLLLMAYSNKFGCLLLNTSNKSESAVGYGTLYGDLCGGLSVIADLYKTQVYELANYINKDKEIIPQNTINKPPSAELRPNQKDSDSLPDYDVLDKILFLNIEQRQDFQEIIAKGFEKNLVERILKMVARNEYKRKQIPPVIRVSSRAFGSGIKMPLISKYF